MHFFALFFCLSHKITFVQPYAGFVCQKEQWREGCLYKLSIFWRLHLNPYYWTSMGKGGNPEDGLAIHDMRRTAIHAHEVVISQRI